MPNFLSSNKNTNFLAEKLEFCFSYVAHNESNEIFSFKNAGNFVAFVFLQPLRFNIMNFIITKGLGLTPYNFKVRAEHGLLS